MDTYFIHRNEIEFHDFHKFTAQSNVSFGKWRRMLDFSGHQEDTFSLKGRAV
jgi:hypothetical protein